MNEILGEMQSLIDATKCIDCWSLNYWTVVAFGELVLLLFFIAFNAGRKKMITRNVLRNDKKIEIDFSNLVTSAFHSDELYDELKKKCHPDRFPNDCQKNIIANDIFQELSRSRNDYGKLIELKNRAVDELGITF